MASTSPTDASAMLFAGQGTDVAKTVRKLVSGPGAENAKGYFERASAVLGYDLLDVVLNQPENLKTTAYSQPAILVAQLAAAYAYEGTCTDVAGFSLGEYSALVYAKAISFEDGVRLIKLRACAMQAAAGASKGSMVTVVGLTDSQLETLCADAVTACGLKDDTIGIANHLFPQGRVLSGGKPLVEWVVAQATSPKYGAAAATELPVAGAFHSPYMAPARAALQECLAEIDIKMPMASVYSNVTAEAYKTEDEIRELLLQQLESPVRWEQTVKAMLSAGAKTFVDAGPGTQLKAMIRRIDRPSFGKTIALDK